MWKFHTTPESDELKHYGILGMKWGVRRYQNKDGSLTAAGKRRQKGQKIDNDNDASDDYKKARSKSTKQMSNEELRAAIGRLQMEKQYRDYYTQLHPTTVSKGRQVVDKIIKTAGDTALDVGKNLAKDYVVKKAKDKLGLNDKKSAFDLEFEALKKASAYATNKSNYESKSGKTWSWDSDKKK